jgi:hypothetical protein
MGATSSALRAHPTADGTMPASCSATPVNGNISKWHRRVDGRQMPSVVHSGSTSTYVLWNDPDVMKVTCRMSDTLECTDDCHCTDYM